MKVLGIVTEYNPFHNGHKYHIQESIKLCSADYVVSVMSGNFIQRGEPAIVNKWSRTHMALNEGVDLVLELPVIYAMSSAEFFSFGAVKILDSLGIVDYICFGSESGNIRQLDLIAEILSDEPEEYTQLLKKYLDSGLSFPSAREKALSDYFSQHLVRIDNISEIMSSSNNILGVEYLKAIKRLKSPIVPKTIPRIGNTYNTGYVTGNISSATSIRKSFSKANHNLVSDILEQTMPKRCIEILKQEIDSGRGPILPENFESIILAFLRKMSSEEIAAMPYVNEGLENRIKLSASVSGTLNELIEAISTRRYPKTRIQRILFYSLIGISDKEFKLFNNHGGPQYIRVLGFNSKGRHLLSLIKEKARLPIIVKTANFKNHCNPLVSRMLEIESNSTDLYVLGFSNPEYRKAGQEYTNNVVIM
ncbi:MAG TPA: nucleotidyltransferase [Clostridiaceae bacterium]|nr:nucleotidyltransferase [Clostridiaceae bacterium]